MLLQRILAYLAQQIIVDRLASSPAFQRFALSSSALATRLRQTADGIRATVVNGKAILKDGVPTGALPGRLLRSKLPG